MFQFERKSLNRIQCNRLYFQAIFNFLSGNFLSYFDKMSPQNNSSIRKTKTSRQHKYLSHIYQSVGPGLRNEDWDKTTTTFVFEYRIQNILLHARRDLSCSGRVLRNEPLVFKVLCKQLQEVCQMHYTECYIFSSLHSHIKVSLLFQSCTQGLCNKKEHFLYARYSEVARLRHMTYIIMEERLTSWT